MTLKKGLFIAVVLSFLTAVGFAEDTKPYVRVSGGLALMNDADIEGGGVSGDAEFDSGYTMGIAAGVALSETPVRVEAEFNYQKNDLDKLEAAGLVLPLDGDVTTMTAMLNGYYDFRNETIVTPYLMAGVGVAFFDFDVEGDSDDDQTVALQLGAGVSVAVSENVSIDTEYRFFIADDPEFDGVEMEASSHQLQMGIRYTF